MNLKSSILLIAIASAGFMSQAQADCGASAAIAATQRSYANARQFERDGNPSSAFWAYVAAQEPTCETNPVELAAAKHAARLALTLGAAAEKQGRLDKAFDFYDNGGQYAAADRVLMARVRSQPDSRSVFEKARQALDHRLMPDFQRNNSVRLSVTAAYRPNLLNLAEVMAIPATAAQRALQKEAAAFDEQYLREYMQLIQMRPDDPSDAVALQRFMYAQQDFRKHPFEDPIKASRDALEEVQSWEAAANDRAVAAGIQAQRRQRIEMRIVLLTQSFAGAPEYLEAAKDYQRALRLDDAATQARLASVKAQAMRLGDEANANGRYALAAGYYAAAEAKAKVAAVHDVQKRIAMTRVQPSLDQMKAQAAQKSLRQQRQSKVAAKAKSAEDVERELGI
jgi:hypothetical protein